MFRDFFDLIFPPLCISCGHALVKNESYICLSCRYRLPVTDTHTHTDNILSRKLWGRLPLRHALAYLYFNKGSHVQSILHHIKYKDAEKAAELLGLWYGTKLYQADFATQFDLIVPVPLHRKKLRKRTYNQSVAFAKGIAEGLTIRYCSHVLERVKVHSSQTNKSRLDRWHNVKEIYKAFDPDVVKGKRVLLADDVATTGATIEACGRVLLEAGAEEVSIVVIAVAG
jgi:ComF family protein